MTKIVLSQPAAGFNLSAINANFQKIQDEFNNKVLYRQNPTGEPNQMINTNQDMNGNRILNLPIPSSANEAARLQDVLNAISGSNVANLISSSPHSWNTATTVQGALNTIVDNMPIMASMYGVLGDGVTNDTPALQSLATLLAGKGGGVIRLNAGMKCLIDTSLTLPVNVSIDGGKEIVGVPGNNTSTPYNSMASALIINPSASVFLSGNCGLKGLVIYKKGLTFPLADSSQFAGTAIQIAGDDTYVYGCLVMGFNQAYLSAGYQRNRINYLLMDNVNGIDISANADIAYIENCHAWPFATIGYSTKPANWSDRLGTAYNLHDQVDWAKLTNCFAYNYNHCYIINNVLHATLINVSCDGTFNATTGSGRDGCVGVLIEGSCQETRILSPQIAVQQTGLVVNITAQTGGIVEVTGGDILGSYGPGVANIGAGVLVISGDVTLSTALRRHFNGVRVTNATSKVFITDETFFDDTTQVIVCDVQTNNVFIKNPGFGPLISAGQQLIVGALVSSTVSTASGVALPHNGKVFHLDTAGNVTDINGWYLGREVLLVFNGVQTVYHIWDGLPTHIKLKGSANITTAAGQTLRLVHDGVQWFEV